MLADRVDGTDTATGRFDAAVTAFLGQRGDTGALLASALAADPHLVAGHALAGFAQMFAARGPLIAEAGASLRRARAAFAERGGSASEAALIDALALWHDRGDMRGCAARLEAAVAADPIAILPLRLSHAVRFMLGDAACMRRTLEAALPSWHAGMPAYPYVLGCHAFALGETGDLAQAERVGRAAVAMQPADLWGAHAVAHAMGGLGRPRDGVAWIETLEPSLTCGGSFVRHIHWHRALCHLKLGEPEVALHLYDRRVRDLPSPEVRDVLNAGSLLWRIAAAGAAVGTRWEELADLSAGRIGEHAWVFADLHYVLCLAAAGRRDDLAAMLASIAARADQGAGTQADLHASVGLTTSHAIAALAEGEADEAARLFDRASPGLPTVGGSNAQRDLFRQMRQQAERTAARLLVA